MEGFFFALAFTGLVVIILLYGMFASKNRRGLSTNSSKFPPTFSSSLSSNEVLSVVEARLKTMESIRTKWKTTEKVEKVGRLQSMLTVPYNLNGDNIRISFLMNLLATNRDAGGCTVEWNYVTMSPLNHTPPEIALLEDEIFKKTTLETRAALFTAQGDAEVADYLENQAPPIRKEIEMPAARESLNVAVESPEVAVEAVKISPPAEKQLVENTNAAPIENAKTLDTPSSILPDLADAELHSLGSSGVDLGKTPMHVAKSIPGTSLPDIVGEELKSISGTVGNPALMEVPEVQSQMPDVPKQADYADNTMNFSPPDPVLSSSASAPGEKCLKCSQVRDPAFNFCLYCGHADA